MNSEQMNDKQKYMSDYISRMNAMQRIVSVRWIDWDDLHIQCGIEYTDDSGEVLVIPLHALDNIYSDYTECDFVLNNLMLKAAFRGNGVEDVPDYPLNTGYFPYIVLRREYNFPGDIEIAKFDWKDCNLFGNRWKLESDPEADPGAEAGE